jgi:uncharacterized membrane protein YkgB
MILVDLNQVMISNLMMQIGGKKNVAIEEDLVRHMVLNSLRMYRTKFLKSMVNLLSAAMIRTIGGENCFLTIKFIVRKTVMNQV